jgi:hypothetical protein
MNPNRHLNSGSSTRRYVIALVLLTLFGIAATWGVPVARADEYVYGCILSQAQEVPPTGSPATGCGQFVIDTVANTVTYRICFGGLAAAEVGAHIHGPAGPGFNGGVLSALPAGNPKVGVWNYVEAQEVDILAGRTYANIHSGAFPAGEIRGQIVPLNATIDGAQETPPVATPGNGWAVFSIDTSTNTLSYHIAFGGLVAGETAAHIHGSALHGVAAGVVFALPLGSPKVGAWNYPEAMEAMILEGRTYVNIHSGAFPGGEIRGQVVPLVLPLDERQEVPPTGSPAIGIGLVSYSSPTNELSFDLQHFGLVGGETGAHIHGFAPFGANAGVLMALPLGPRKIGTWVFGPAARINVQDGLTYFNIHSNVFPGGEIRGQIRGFPKVFPAGVEDPGFERAFRLAANAPNPFQGSTTIEFSLEKSMPVQLSIYDVQGRLVRTLVRNEAAAGTNRVEWNGLDNAGRTVPSGSYGYVLQTPQGEMARRLVLTR